MLKLKTINFIIQMNSKIQDVCNQLFIYLLDKININHVSQHREKYNKWLKKRWCSS